MSELTGNRIRTTAGKLGLPPPRAKPSTRSPAGPAREGRPERLPAAHHRTHGVRCFHGRYSVGEDRLWGVNHCRKGADHTLAALKSIRAARPDVAPIHIILDNLSAPCAQDDPRLGPEEQGRAVLHPSYASWANPVEAHLGPLRRFTLANSSHPKHTVQTNALHPLSVPAQRPRPPP
ncbi:transposase [Streptomyces sp. NBC_01235]|nr:transposase [Streptomyces sp. NBC_01235]